MCMPISPIASSTKCCRPDSFHTVPTLFNGLRWVLSAWAICLRKQSKICLKEEQWKGQRKRTKTHRQTSFDHSIRFWQKIILFFFHFTIHNSFIHILTAITLIHSLFPNGCAKMNGEWRNVNGKKRRKNINQPSNPNLFYVIQATIISSLSDKMCYHHIAFTTITTLF